ncbi:hypothetical protein HN51_017060 [Arachis hypogaea]
MARSATQYPKRQNRILSAVVMIDEGQQDGATMVMEFQGRTTSMAIQAKVSGYAISVLKKKMANGWGLGGWWYELSTSSFIFSSTSFAIGIFVVGAISTSPEYAKAIPL